MQILPLDREPRSRLDQSAQADAKCWDALRVELSVLDTSATSAFSLAGFLRDILRDGRAADFLFALDQNFTRTGSLPFTANSASTALMCLYIWL